MFKLKGIKFEKINMKLVVAIGIAVILILTVIFIYFKTDIIVDRSNNKKDPDVKEKPNGEDKDKEDPDKDKDKEDPDYSDPDDDDELTISEEAKNRTKPANKLNLKEIEYIIQENFEEFATDSARKCESTNKCSLEAIDFLTYTENPKLGILVADCKGTFKFHYDTDKKEFVYDMTGLTCKKNS